MVPVPEQHEKNVRKNGDSKRPRRDVRPPSNNVVVSSPNWGPSPVQDFFLWCQQVLGIHSILEVQTFQYYDYFHVRMEEVEQEQGSGDSISDDDAFYSPSVDDFPLIPVRGLAAAQDISVGDVVISIPFHAMITVSTTIDHDPVLSQLMGPHARSLNGWDDTYYELPLLTVAILYHRHLGQASPLHHYLQILLSSPVDTMPFLWDRDKLRREATEGVQRIARGIKRDVREMYDAVMTVLIAKHPSVFGKIDQQNDNDWMYSFEKFQWAFALVNSRHWHLPIEELDREQPLPHVKKNEQHVAMSSTVSAGVPPAETPTDEWVREQEVVDDENTANEGTETDAAGHVDMEGDMKEQGHSFLAPVADLLNFGPPCTRGQYNSDTRRFELIATCPFKKGQEVTFWYSDDCDDAVIANYGFTHPMVPKCLSLQDWKHQSELSRRHADAMEQEVYAAYEEIDRLDVELKRTQTVLDNCGDCGRYDSDDSSERYRQGRARRAASRDARDTAHETGVRGGVRRVSGSEKESERRKWQRSIKSSL